MTKLPESSGPHRPALAARNTPFDSSLYIAWTDPDGELNVMPTDDFGAKRRLGETSTAGPALAVVNHQLVIAWTDDQARLNVMDALDGSNKTTLDESSISGPALMTVISEKRLDELYIAWTGTDGEGHLNVMPLDDPSRKNTLTWTSSAGPALAADGTGQMTIVWTNRSGGLEWSPAYPREGLGHGGVHATALDGPAMCRHGLEPNSYVAWTARDSHLNVVRYRDEPRGGSLADTSVAGPALAEFNGALHLAWVGTDGAHSLNVAPLSL